MDVESRRKTTLVTICDIHDKHLIGMTVLAQQLSETSTIDPGSPLVVLCPEHAEGAVERWHAAFSLPVHVLACDAPGVGAGDPYALKFLLLDRRIAEVAAGGTIVYLDYDTLCLRRLAISLEHGAIMVGSEIGDLADLGKAVIDTEVYRDLRGLHYNTSLIAIEGDTLSGLGPSWLDAYIEIAASIPVRWREEVAFTLAAVRMSLPLTPAPASLQACWPMLDRSATLFHYGGPSPLASAAKDEILSSGSFRGLVGGRRLAKASLEMTVLSTLEKRAAAVWQVLRARSSE